MSVEDIRILTNFKDHRKRRKLRKLLGPTYLDHLLDLWLTVAEERPTGELFGWDDDDLVHAASATVPVKKNPAAFRDALLEVGFLEKNGSGNLKIHDWEIHQKWVIARPAREAKSKHANIVKQVKRDFCKVCSGHYSKDASEDCPEDCPLKTSDICPFAPTGSPPGEPPFLLPSYSLPSPFLLLSYSNSNKTPCGPPSQGGRERQGKRRGNGNGQKEDISGAEYLKKYGKHMNWDDITKSEENDESPVSTEI